MTADIKLPPFEAVQMDEISKIAATARASFASQKTKDVEWRLVQLRKLWWGLTDYTDRIAAALKQDLNKDVHDSLLSEIGYLQGDMSLCLKKLKTWVKDDPNLDYPLTFFAMRPHLRKEPLGTVLIIGPYNFPLMLCLAPLIGAIAAGCTAVVKPSESAPATSMVMREMIEACLDQECFRVVTGAVPETTALLNEKWDKIFYTGNPTVARIIAKKAAETLTPVVLELGGKNPAIVTRSANVPLSARRLLWGKTHNAGQVCMSHNYVLVEREILDDFIAGLKQSYKDFFPEGAKASEAYSKIVNERQFDRLQRQLASTHGRIVMGGEMDRSRLYMEPTAVLVDSADDPMMEQESFGPIWSILPFDQLGEAIKIMNTVDRTPLALMTFGSKAENEKVLSHVTSGGATINDAWMHGAIPTLPFGGVGESGTGAYHGKASFDTFTHLRTVAQTPGWMDKLLRVRYLPHLPSELRFYLRMNNSRPDFDREGRTLRGPAYYLWLVLGLGGPSAKGALLRWALVLAAGYAALLQYYPKHAS
ncbi:aldehyde dehydrogenase [Xylariaceae sp. FL0804]|nr:aldehyde dehydrogenase [Xylariaceae sp. FL0804]